MSLNRLIGIFVLILVGVSLLPTIQGQINSAGVNGTTLTMLNLVPILYAVGLAVVAIKIASSLGK